jgi:hypothetical protein
MQLELRDIRSERTPWQYVERSRRKGYLHRDFNVGGRWFRHFASGADHIGLIRYGYLIAKKETE